MAAPVGEGEAAPQPEAGGIPAAGQEADKIAILLTSYTELDARAKEALHALTLQQVVKILSDYEQKKPSIRNPSGFVYKTAIRWSEGTATVDDDECSPQLPERTPQQEMEIQAAVTQHNLNETAQGLLRQLTYRTAMRILNDLESKGSTVRNPSAYCSTAARKARQREDKRRQKDPAEGGPGQAAGGEVEVVDVVNHYEALEVEDTADEGAIKKAYRKLVLKWHPDKHPADRDEAEEKIRAINEAYEVLSNPAKKGAYDQQRRAVEQRKMGKVLRSTICVKTDLPRECMLQPVGYPDKFVRYRQATGRSVAQCFVQSRAEARREGSDITLEEFMPFFEATKLSFWWLPEVNSMCRIRAAELGTRETKGEAVRAGKAGGLNLAFKPDPHESEQDSAVKLIEARKGEMKEQVNFIVMPSPYYEGAFRFEAAYNPGYFIAFRPPTALRVIPYADGMDTNCIVDFSLIDFAHMFKFIELEEVLRSAMHSSQSWMPLDVLKMDSNVQAYFGNILGAPMWDDEDFQTYFAGHFDIWEYRGDLRSVRLRTREERLGLELQTVATPEQMAQKVVTAAPETLMRLPWRAVRHAFEVLNRSGSEEVSSVLARMEAKRKLIGLLGGVLATAQAEKDSAAPPLVAIVGLAYQVHQISGDPGLAKNRDEAVDLLVKRVVAEVNVADQSRGHLDLELVDYADLIALPGMADCSDAILRLLSPYLKTGSLKNLLAVADAANAAGMTAVTTAASTAAFNILNPSSLEDVCLIVKTVLKTGLLEERCLSLLPRCADSMDVGDLASCVVYLANKAGGGTITSNMELSKAIAVLMSKAPLARKLTPEGLMNLAVAGTKTDLLSPLLGSVAEAAAVTLGSFSSADVIRFLLAIAKAKGTPIEKECKDKLFQQAAEILRPQLPRLSIVEIIKVGLASSCAAGPGELLETVALEAEKRLVDMQPAQLLLLTQAFVPLGGACTSVQRIVERWIEILEGEGGEGALNAEQLSKLVQVLDPTLTDLGKGTLSTCLTIFGARILAKVDQFSAPAKESIAKLFAKSDGFGSWSQKDRLLRCLPQTAAVTSSSRMAAEDQRTADRSRSRNGDECANAPQTGVPAGRASSRSRSRGRPPMLPGLRPPPPPPPPPSR